MVAAVIAFGAGHFQLGYSQRQHQRHVKWWAKIRD